MKHAVFGLGYTGKFLQKHFSENSIESDFFSRKTKNETSILADLSNPETVNKIFPKSSYKSLLLTFPLHDIKQESLLSILAAADQAFLFSSTGVFKRSNQLISEESKKDPTHKRYIQEKFWLQNGGKIIYLSGIYGPERNPVDWILKGKIQSSPRQLNMIHVDDIVKYTTFLMQMPNAPQEIILSDGQIHSWQDTFLYALQNGWIQQITEGNSEKENAWVNSNRIQFLTGIPPLNFWKELDKIQS